MWFLRQPDFVKEITGLNLSTNRKYLAVNEEQYNDKNAYVSFWNINNLEKPICLRSVNISEIILGTARKNKD